MSLQRTQDHRNCVCVCVCECSWFCRWFKRRKTKFTRRCLHCYHKEGSNAEEVANLCDNCTLKDLLCNYRLNDVDSFSLFEEFLEMGM